MRRIGIISDTHGYLDDALIKHLSICDEIWHAGDIGAPEVTQRLAQLKPIRAVVGNVDGGTLRQQFPKTLLFTCEEVSVMLTHIGGYPGKYDKEAFRQIITHQPMLFVCGHSHILKVMYDKTYNMLCINPGAAGLQGFHNVRTLIRLEIDGENMKNLEVIELPKHAPIPTNE